VNLITPRVFVAATQQNDGKTTTALGLFAALKQRFGRIGFIKPVGQRFVEIDGKQIDEDTVLMEHTFGVQIPLEDMSPIAVEPNFTRKYIDRSNSEHLVRRIQHSFDRASWEKEFTIIEGTGHAGVGSVFDLSNARVARLLHSKVVLVTRGGIGRAIDEVVLNKALFDREGVEMVGVILNKVLPGKYEQVEDFARRGLRRLGIELLGAIPDEPLLADASLGQISKQINGSFLSVKPALRLRVRRIVIGAMSSAHVMEYFAPGTLVITPGDREDVILAALSTSSLTESSDKCLAGLVLSGDLLPHQSVLDLIRASELPVMASPLDSYTVANSIYSMTVKTLPDDVEKISRIQALIDEHVDVDRLVEKLQPVKSTKMRRPGD
jgi:BioD-like phosphotransacetylase family protein